MTTLATSTLRRLISLAGLAAVAIFVLGCPPDGHGHDHEHGDHEHHDDHEHGDHEHHDDHEH